MKKLIYLFLFLVISKSTFSQMAFSNCRYKPEFYEYPSKYDFTRAIKISVENIKKLSTQDIIDSLKNPYSFLDSSQYIGLLCKDFFEFKFRFCRIGQDCITGINSDNGKISFHMRLLLNEGLPGDYISFYDIRCKTPDGSHHPYAGISFLVEQ